MPNLSPPLGVSGWRFGYLYSPPILARMTPAITERCRWPSCTRTTTWPKGESSETINPLRSIRMRPGHFRSPRNQPTPNFVSRDHERQKRKHPMRMNVVGVATLSSLRPLDFFESEPHPRQPLLLSSPNLPPTPTPPPAPPFFIPGVVPL